MQRRRYGQVDRLYLHRLGALFSRVEALGPDEVAQFRRDRASWEQRLAGIAAERDRELAAIAARYRDRQPHRFPVAVGFVVPEREATRGAWI